ncbi:MAG TPA: HDIG domain-containing protein [bacterium]|nr:HDIG domain-containing protein [bacterium]
MNLREQIEETFGRWLEQIRSESLKNQVVDTWELGCQRGNWESMRDVAAMPFSLLIDCRGIGFIEHTLCVTEGAAALAAAQEKNYRNMPYAVNRDHLVAGGLLHDVGKLLEIEKDESGAYRKSLSGKRLRHPISGAILAAECGVPESVVHIIACHAKEGEGRPKQVETVLIHQADFATFDPLTLIGKKMLIQDNTE